MESNPNSFLKSILWTVSIIIGIILGSIAIWQGLKQPYQLEARILAAQAPLPQKIIDDLNNLGNISIEDIRKEYKEVPEVMNIPDSALKRGLPLFSRIIKDYLASISEQPYIREEYLTVIAIHNTGDQIITGVEFRSKYPFKGIAQIERDDGKREVLKFSGKLPIGNLSPRSEVLVYHYSSSPGMMMQSSVTLSHDKGLGKIRFFQRAPDFLSTSDGFSIFYYEIWSIISTISMILLTGAVLFLVVRSFHEKKQKEKQKEAEEAK